MVGQHRLARSPSFLGEHSHQWWLILHCPSRPNPMPSRLPNHALTRSLLANRLRLSKLTCVLLIPASVIHFAGQWSKTCVIMGEVNGKIVEDPPLIKSLACGFPSRWLKWRQTEAICWRYSCNEEGRDEIGSKQQALISRALSRRIRQGLIKDTIHRLVNFMNLSSVVFGGGSYFLIYFVLSERYITLRRILDSGGDAPRRPSVDYHNGPSTSVPKQTTILPRLLYGPHGKDRPLYVH